MSSNRPAPTPAAVAVVVVRLYRCDPARLDAVAGIAEVIATGVPESFRDGAGLIAILQGAARDVDSTEASPACE